MQQRLKILLDAMMQEKPAGWSAVVAVDKIVIRPPNRDTCKFSIELYDDGKAHVSRFDRQRNHWTGFATCDLSAKVLWEHVISRIDEVPLR